MKIFQVWVFERVHDDTCQLILVHDSCQLICIVFYEVMLIFISNSDWIQKTIAKFGCLARLTNHHQYLSQAQLCPSHINALGFTWSLDLASFVMPASTTLELWAARRSAPPSRHLVSFNIWLWGNIMCFQIAFHTCHPCQQTSEN
jgi:hypothetical protein